MTVTTTTMLAPFALGLMAATCASLYGLFRTRDWI